MSAIVAALAVATSAALTGCGQRGPLYLPTVPPLPEKPALRTAPSAPSEHEQSDSQAASETSGASGNSSASAHAPLTLAPADSLDATPRATPEPGAASNPASNQ